jgi:phenylacetate-CoA ligase
MTDAFLHPDFETLPPADARKLQDSLWAQQWPYVKASVFYQQKLGRTFARDIVLNQLAELPCTEKDDLRKSQEFSYPFGDYIRCREDQIVRLHRTSGTTGRPLHLASSQKDVSLVAKVGGRALFAAGVRPGDRVVHCLNYCMWTGGLTDHMALETAGACVIPFGTGNTAKLLEIIEDLGVNVISSTPSYPSLLEEILRETSKKRPRDLGLRLGLFGGEAGLDNPELRAAMENTWGFGVRNANYGMSEVLSLFASQCERTNDLHFHGSDAVFIEILDANENSLPVREGTTGELVCTHLAKECQPLIRYRTRDVITITATAPCECGRTAWRFRVTGRTDDMFNVRGVNVFPTAVQKAILSRPDIASGQFRIILNGPGPYDRVEVKAEAAASLAATDWANAAKRLARVIQETAGASAEVVLVPIGHLPRTDGKTSWIERIRA